MNNNEKKLYCFNNFHYNVSDKYAKLSAENIKFLKWLDENDFLCSDLEYDEIDELPNIAEF